MAIMELVEQMRLDGVEVALADNGKVSLSGSRASVDSWLPVIRERKQEIAAWLKLDAELKVICAGMDRRGRLAGDYFRSLILEKCREDAGERAAFLFAEPKKGALG